MLVCIQLPPSGFGPDRSGWGNRLYANTLRLEGRVRECVNTGGTFKGEL